MPDHDEPDPLRAYPPSFFDPRYPEEPPDEDDGWLDAPLTAEELGAVQAGAAALEHWDRTGEMPPGYVSMDEGPPTGPLIDPEGRCERCGRLVPIECPEPDGLSCGSYVLEVTAEEGEDTRALVERLRAMLPPSPRDGETSIGYGQAKRPEPPPGARSILWQDPAAGPGRTGVIAARQITGDGEIRGPLVVSEAITTVYPSGESYTDPTPRLASALDNLADLIGAPRKPGESDDDLRERAAAEYRRVGDLGSLADLAETIWRGHPDDPRPGAREQPTADIDEEAFFAAMDDIVERVTGTRPEPRGCPADEHGGEDPAF